MINIPTDILSQYSSILDKKSIPISYQYDYKKWLRYYFDFCHKYSKIHSNKESLVQFMKKLQEKHQPQIQQKQAAHAISLYFEILRKPDNESPTAHIDSKTTEKATSPSTPFIKGESSRTGGFETLPYIGAETPSVSVDTEITSSSVSEPQRPTYTSKAEYAVTSGSPEWDMVIANLAAEIKTRHYSKKTLKAYALWSRQFQKFLRNKPPLELSSADVKEYLTYLAVKCHVAASTQNQAFNALLFLFRHVLKKDFGDHRNIPRAKKSNYIPVVLSRQEIDAVLKHLQYPYDLVVKLLYGCGLRLFECLQLRVKDFNFDAKILTIHGKGKKDRTVPIPHTILLELTAQLKTVNNLYDKDLAAGYTGVFLDNLLEKKYPSAAKDFIWQWFFPQKTLTPIPGTQEIRRYHLHETHVQKG